MCRSSIFCFNFFQTPKNTTTPIIGQHFLRSGMGYKVKRQKVKVKIYGYRSSKTP
jgi:hypothetical protein